MRMAAPERASRSITSNTSSFRAHVDAAGGLVEQKYPRVPEQPLRNHHLLLVAAAEPSGELPRGPRSECAAVAM